MSSVPPQVNPFPGLRPFTQEEDYLFFGREEQTLELLQRLGSNRFVAVVGTSGSGRTSDPKQNRRKQRKAFHVASTLPLQP